MKFLMLLVLFLMLAYLWRSSRAGASRPAAPVTAPTPTATAMLACAVCGVHLPSEDAIPGHNGVYCSPAHRKQREP